MRKFWGFLGHLFDAILLTVIVLPIILAFEHPGLREFFRVWVSKSCAAARREWEDWRNE
jgi:hypothetical protein